MKSENNTEPSVAQQQNEPLSYLRARFRAAYGANGIARVLLEDQAQMGGMLEGREREALMSALEHCTETLYAFHEHAYFDALPSAADQGGAQ